MRASRALLALVISGCGPSVEADDPTCAAGEGSAQGGCVVVIASGQPSPWAVVADGGEVYWTDLGVGSDDGDVRGAAIEGGEVSVLAAGQPRPIGIAVDGSWIYWLSAPGTAWSLRRVSRGGGEAVELASGMGGSSLSRGAIALDASSVYWLTQDAVMRASLSGGPAEALATEQASPYGLAVDEGNVYWVTRGSPSAPGAVMKVAVSGGAATTLATDAEQPWAIAVDVDRVYWTDAGAGALKSVAKGGGSPETWVTGLGLPANVVVDDARVVTTSLEADAAAPGSIVEVQKSDRSSVVLADGQGEMHGLFSGDGTLVWASYSEGTVSALTLR